MMHGKFTFSLALASTLLVVVLLGCCSKKNYLPVVPNKDDQVQQPQRRIIIEHHPSIDRDLQEDDNDQLVALAEKLKVQNLEVNGSSLIPHQFLHLHNMKTGGTSMDGMMKCARQRMEDDTGVQVPYYNIHECTRGKYKRCKAGEEPKCNTGMNTSAIISYCAPLHDLPTFGWEDHHYQSVTVLRHPVDRVWSMFRFQTKVCYKCKTLKEVYQMIEANKTQPLDSLCLGQLQNKETENMLTSWQTARWNGATDEEMVEEATRNMKNFFTLVGLTSKMADTHAMVGRVFPWLNETVAGSETACPMPHENSTPKNNHCGPDFTHWDLPDHPDEETRKLIEKHNQMDLKLYAAAVDHFELQKRALRVTEEAI
jgi:hypothetical protein